MSQDHTPDAISETPTPKKLVVPRFFSPRNTIKEKAGTGGIDETKLLRAQKEIDTNPFDFRPMAQDLLGKLKEQLDTLESVWQNDANSTQSAMQNIIRTVMEIKANGGMFGYKLLGDVANVSLVFTEEIDGINPDTLEVLRAHKKTMNLIVLKSMAVDGIAQGNVLIDELLKVNNRYFIKHPKKIRS